MEQLYAKLANAGLVDDMGNIILERYPDDNYQAVDKATFEMFFGDVATKPTYKALSGTHSFTWGEPATSVTATATELGYQKYFDEWKAQGILV